MLDLNKHPFNSRHDIDSAMSIIWEYYKKWFIPLFTISFVASLLTNMLSSGLDLSQLQEITDPALLIEAFKPFISQYFIIALVGLIFSLILQYYVIVKPLDEEGNVAGWSSRMLVRFFLPMIAVYIVLIIIAIITFMLGIIALVIGAFFAIFYMIIFFTLAAPVMMVEETSIINTLSRIFKLGHKKFGIALGWTSLYVVLIVVVSLLLSTLTMIPFGAGVLKSIFNPEAQKEVLEFAKNPLFILLASITSALTMPVQALFALMLYFNLRSYEEEAVGYDNDSHSERRVTVDDLTP